jgi:hypothetical protein
MSVFFCMGFNEIYTFFGYYYLRKQEYQTMSMNDYENLSLKKLLLQGSADIVVKESLREVQIVDVIVRNGFPSIFIAAYRDLTSTNQYLFYKEELSFPKTIRGYSVA